MIKFNVYKIDNHNPIYGPYNRTVIWFAGCSLHCKGCINPELWVRKDEYYLSLEELLAMIKEDHVTLLGGEPLEQENLEFLVDALKSKDIGIILFTGYSLKELDGRKSSICDKCDVVISERFDISLKDDNLYLRGSTNQIISFNSNRYDKNDFDKPNQKLIKISKDVSSYGRDKGLINELLEL